ncbi:hypothetical protein NC651_007905 [Populus alba x Populus x berolinensis]|nr:hypothetical protein NC651_007905 [Populus alba x Populus x berolinensis]
MKNFFGSSAQHYIFDVFILGINRCKIVVSNVFKNVPENNLDKTARTIWSSCCTRHPLL